jgi:hypothetical protein
MVDGNLIGLVDFNNDFTGNYTWVYEIEIVSRFTQLI